MNYFSGSASSFSDLKSALETAAVAEGWTLTSNVLNKDGFYIFFVPASNNLVVEGGTGQSGSVVTGGTLTGAMLYSPGVGPITWPVTYEIFTFDNPSEIYLIINYNGDFYQNLSFGISDIPGIGGVKGWFSASGSGALITGIDGANMDNMFISADRQYVGSINYIGFSGGMFFQGQSAPYSGSFLHTGMDTVGWKSPSQNLLVGSPSQSHLLTSAPSPFNNAVVLIPIKVLQIRSGSSQLSTIVLNLKNARYCRIDYVNPGEIISYGGDDWKIYPLYRKNSLRRNGVPWANVGFQESGTFGFAIRANAI